MAFLFDLNLLPGTTDAEKIAEKERRFRDLSDSDRRLNALIGAVEQFVQANLMQESSESWLRGEEHPGHTEFKASLRREQTSRAQARLREIEEREADAKMYWERGTNAPHRKVERKMDSLKGATDKVLALLGEVLDSNTLWNALASSVYDVGYRRNPPVALRPADFVRDLQGQLKELSDAIARDADRESQSALLSDLRRHHLATMAHLARQKWQLLEAMVAVASEETYTPTANSLRKEYSFISNEMRQKAEELSQKIG